MKLFLFIKSLSIFKIIAFRKSIQCILAAWENIFIKLILYIFSVRLNIANCYVNHYELV